MAAPGRPRRRVRPRAEPRAAGRDRRQARHQGRDERRHPRRRVARGRDGDRLPPRQHRHRRARAARVVREGDRDVRRPGGRRPRRPRPHAGRARLDAGGRRPLRDPRPPRRRGLCALRGHRRQQGRHAPGPEPPAAARTSAPPPTRPVVASGGVTTLDDIRGADGSWCPIGVEGAIAGTALYTGQFTLEDALAPDQGRTRYDAGRPGDPMPGRRRRPRGQGRQLPGPAGRRRPRRAREAVRRRGRRRADLPRHLRLPRGPGDHDGDRLRDGRAGLHPAHRRWGSLLRRRRRPAAPCRCRQDRRQHRRHQAAAS